MKLKSPPFRGLFYVDFRLYGQNIDAKNALIRTKRGRKAARFIKNNRNTDTHCINITVYSWSRRQDLNLRPHGPEPCALPDCATPRRHAAGRLPPDGTNVILPYFSSVVKCLSAASRILCDFPFLARMCSIPSLAALFPPCACGAVIPC